MIEAAFDGLRSLVGTKGACLAVGRARASHYRRGRPSPAGPPKPRPTPPNALSPLERAAVLAQLHDERFMDDSPAQVWATLLDEGTWLASPSTMYRLLRTNDEVRERRRQATHPPRTVPELVAAEPDRVWSCDATALRGPARGIRYDLFVMLDILSRYSPGRMVVERGQYARVVRDSDRGRGERPWTHPCRPAGRPYRSRLGDDLKGRRGPARGPAHRAHPRPAAP